MAQTQIRQNNFLDFINRNFVALAVIVSFLMFIVPLHTVLLDVFMAMNLSVAVLLLLTVISTPKPSRLTTFPQIIQLVTLFGLGINVASTKLILTKGSQFDGRMVRAFSSFVVGSDKGSDGLVVGMVIFIILIVIQNVNYKRRHPRKRSRRPLCLGLDEPKELCRRPRVEFRRDNGRRG